MYNFFLDTYPFLSWDGGKAEVVLAEVDADGGGEAAKLLPLAVVAVVVVVIVELRLLRHPSHPLWGAGVILWLTLLSQNNHPQSSSLHQFLSNMIIISSSLKDVDYPQRFNGGPYSR